MISFINFQRDKQGQFMHPWSEAEFKEFEPWLKNGWFHLKKVYSMFHELSRRSIETGFWWNLDAAQIY